MSSSAQRDVTQSDVTQRDDRVDRCPGALRLHAAADGGLARVRIPGGRLTAHQLVVLRTAAVDLGDGTLELTSRANVQIRGIAAGAEAELGTLLADAGLLPSATHERIRNIIASPLNGTDDLGLLSVYPLVTALDIGICGTPALAALPGRFLVVVDDGRGDVIGLGGDVGLLAVDGHRLAVALGGTDSGIRVRPAEAVDLVRAAATAFLAERESQGSSAWRLTELANGPARVAERISGFETTARRLPAARLSSRHPTPIGTYDDTDALVVGAPLGRLDPDQASALVEAAGELRITPWRSVVIPHRAGSAALTAVGLIATPDSRWLGVTACAGRPRCDKALADVRADAATAVAQDARGSSGQVHWAGCTRRCGRPAGRVVDVVATADGYEVSADGRTDRVTGLHDTIQVVRGRR